MNHTNILEQLGLNRTHHKKLMGHFNVGVLKRLPFEPFDTIGGFERDETSNERTVYVKCGSAPFPHPLYCSEQVNLGVGPVM